MSDLGRFFRAERVKWRKSWTLVTIVLAPICQSGFLLTILWYSEDLVTRYKPGFEFWLELNYLAWSFLFLPVVVALVSELSWDLELEAKAWNLLLAQPVPRRVHYLVKLLSHLVLIFLTHLLLVLLLIPEGLLLQKHWPQVWGTFPPDILIQFAGYSFLASIPLVAFHTWLSTRLPGFGVALATTLGGTWVCAKLAGTTPWIQLLPWGPSSEMITFFDRWKRHIPWEHLVGGIACAVLMMWLGTVDFSRNRAPKH